MSGSPTVAIKTQPPGARNRALKFSLGKLAPVALVLLLILLWQLIVRVFGIRSFLVPAPTDILEALIVYWPRLMSNAAVTIQEIVIGFSVAVIAGVSIALMLHISRTLRQALFPLLIMTQTIPVVVFAPILVVLLGFGLEPKIVIVALICFFPIVITTVDGLQSVDRDQRELMTTLHGSRLSILWRVEIPSSLPYMFSGARIAATYASIGAVFAEWAGAAAGLGFLIQQNTATLNTALMFAAVIVLSLIAFTLVGFVVVLERLVIPWAPRFQSKKQ